MDGVQGEKGYFAEDTKFKVNYFPKLKKYNLVICGISYMLKQEEFLGLKKIVNELVDKVEEDEV